MADFFKTEFWQRQSRDQQTLIKVYAVAIALLLVTLIFFWLTPPPPLPKSGPIVPGPIAEEPKATTAKKKLAIVIDDIGYQVDIANRLMRLSPKLTFAIIPNAPYATELAKKAHASGHELLIHMPMQAMVDEKSEQDALRVDMSSEQIERLLENAKLKVPHAIGLNNHMGSRFTSDFAATQRLVQLIQPHPWFILDSRTTQNSTLAQLATQYRIPNLSRTHFLDNDKNPEAILKQLQAAYKRALQGSAIAIGHPYPETAAALEQFAKQQPHFLVDLTPLSKLLPSKVAANRF